jgi:uncharacterized protein involved in outer membrane biogenesis
MDPKPSQTRPGDLSPVPHALGGLIRRHRGLTIAGCAAAIVVLAIVVFLMVFDWDWIRGPISRYASARTGRYVRIDGHLRVRLLTWTPTVQVGGLKIGNPRWQGAGDTAQVQRLTVSAKLFPLFIGHLDLPLVDIDQPRFDLLRDADGRENWVMGAAKAKTATELPPIQKFIIRNGQLSMRDIHRKMTLTGTVSAAEGAQAGRQGFALDGKGTMNAEPFLLHATGGPLIHVERNKPYAFKLDVRAGATHLVAEGQLLKPFNLGQIDGSLTASGPNLKTLYPLTGVLFPATPKYDLSTRFKRDGNRFDLTEIRGRVGDSDLEGRLSVDKPGDRRRVEADLTSRKLVFTDLLAVIGGGPKAAAAKDSPAAPAPTRAGMLMPDATLQTTALRTFDASLKYRALAVETGKWPLRRFSLDLVLDNGVLVMNPLDFEFPQGKLAGRVKIDATKATPVTDLDMRLTNVAVQQFLKPTAKGDSPIEGVLQARAQLHGVGDSMHKAAATANGKVVMAIPHGKIRQAFAELLGINVANGLYLLLSNDPRETDLRCAVASFDVKGGVARVDTAVFDTGVVRAQGAGSVNLGDESLDLRLNGQPKKPRLLRLWAPITLKGSLLHPRPGVDAGKAVGQIGIAATVGAVLAPLAAILPFVDGGLAKDADCVSLVGEAQAQGAPVKVSAATPAKPVKR